jgi:CTD small phosphatase-like protein 2
VFDIDETLVHCITDKSEDSHIRLKIDLPNNKKTKVGLNIRPGVKDALLEICNDYHCIAYTASEKCYADKVLDHIDPESKIFQYRLYRNNCVKVEHESKTLYIKDLRIINNVDLKNLIIIDNSVLSFSFQLENGIPILPYYDNKDDSEMKFLVKYLKHLSNNVDIRVENSKMMQLESLMKKLEEKISSSSLMFETDSRISSLKSDLIEDDCKCKFIYKSLVQVSEDLSDYIDANLRRSIEDFSSFGDKSLIKDDIYFVWSRLKDMTFDN